MSGAPKKLSSYATKQAVRMFNGRAYMEGSGAQMVLAAAFKELLENLERQEEEIAELKARIHELENGTITRKLTNKKSLPPGP